MTLMYSSDSDLEFPNKTSVDFDYFAKSIISTLPIRAKTRESYNSAFRCHLSGKFGMKSVAEVTKRDVLSVLAPLTPPIRSKTFAIVKTIFREAEILGLIEDSPTAGIHIPVPIVSNRKFLTWEEFTSAKFGKYETQLRFLALHGLRWGEAVVLEPSDIRGDRVYINRSIHGMTKSQSGVRVVPLVSEFKPLPKSPKTLRKELAPYGVTIHSLRHTFAYILKSQGVHVTTAQKLLGHSDVKVTLQVYTQVLDDEIDAAGELIRQIC